MCGLERVTAGTATEKLIDMHMGRCTYRHARTEMHMQMHVQYDIVPQKKERLPLLSKNGNLIVASTLSKSMSTDYYTLVGVNVALVIDQDCLFLVSICF